MQLTRQEKEGLVDELAQMMDEYPVVGVLDMHSLPAKQLQEIKKELVGEATIKMTRKTLIQLALEKSDKENIIDLTDNTAIQPALIFTEQNPFTLYRTIQEKKTSAPASGGEIAPSDIVVEEGMTDLDPGPMLGKIQELGADTAVEDGKIKITESSVAVEEGETIARNEAEIMSTLGMEPLEVGLDLKLVYENGDVFGKDVLDIDTDAYRQDFEAATSGAHNLAVNAGYITDQTALPLLQQNASKAHNLALNAAVVNDETIDDLLSMAAGHGRGLDSQLDLEDVEIPDERDAEEDAESGDEAADEQEAADDEGSEDADEAESAEDDADSDAEESDAEEAEDAEQEADESE